MGGIGVALDIRWFAFIWVTAASHTLAGQGLVEGCIVASGHDYGACFDNCGPRPIAKDLVTFMICMDPPSAARQLRPGAERCHRLSRGVAVLAFTIEDCY